MKISIYKFPTLILLFWCITTSAQTYRTWIGSSGGSWNTASNWSGSDVPDSNTEIAVFNNFTGTVILNISTLNVGGFSVLGSNLLINNNTNNARVMNINDGVTGIDFRVENSTLTLHGSTSNNQTVSIVPNAASTGIFINSIVIQGSTNGTANRAGFITNSTASVLSIDGTSVLKHDFDIGTIPVATWLTGSTLSITGTASSSPTINAQTFYNFVWNTPNNASNRVLQQVITVLGTFTLENTGTAALSLNNGNNSTRHHIVNNFVQNGGNLSFALDGNGNTIGQMSVMGNFTQNGGVISRVSGSSASNKIALVGTTNQNITLISMTSGNFEVNKPSGIAILLANTYLPANLDITAGSLSIGNNNLVVNGIVSSGGGTIVGGNTSNLVLSVAGGGASTLPPILYGLGNFTSLRTANVTLGGDLSVSGVLSMAGSGSLAVASNTLSYFPASFVGTSTQISTGNTSTLHLLGNGATITVPGGVSPRLLRNLSIENALDAILPTNINVSQNVSIAGGVLVLNTNNLSVGGAVFGSFSNGNFISQNSAGKLVKTYTSLPSSFYFPIGKGTLTNGNATLGGINIASLSATAPSFGTIQADEVYASAPGILDANYAINKYWSITAPGLSNVNASFTATYNGSNLAVSGLESSYLTGYYLSSEALWSTGSTSEVSGRVAMFNLSAANGLSGNYTVGGDDAFVAATLYTYQNGPWNDPNVWTEDPSGTTLVNPQVPSALSKVYILNGKTVTLNANVTTTGHTLVINSGGTFDMNIYTITSINALSGQGLLRLKSSNFPTISNNSFSLSSGGTVEYYNFSGVIPTYISTYNNLWLTKDDNSSNAFVYQLGSNLTTNGDLRVRNLLNMGTSALSIGTTTTGLTINIYGNLINGDPAGNATSAIISVSGYNAQHTTNIYKDFSNYSTVLFSNGTQYNANAANQSLRLFFYGSTDNEFLCDGPTTIFDMSVRKGTDKTYILHLYANDASYFNAYVDGDVFNLNNVNSKGTLKLGNNINLTRIISGAGNIDLGSSSNSGIGLWVDGANLTFATASTNTANALVVYSKFRISNGSITLGDEGLVPRQDGEVQIEGGVVNITKYRTSTEIGENPRGSFNISGGVVNINPDAIDGSSNATSPMFSMPYSDQVFIMSGGEINIYTQERSTTASNAVNGGILIACADGNYNVTGGTFNVSISGTGSTSFNINSKAPFYNLNINRIGTNNNSLTLQDQGGPYTEDNTLPNPFPSSPLVVKNKLTIGGTLPTLVNLGSQSLYINKDFEMQSGSTLNAASGSIIFNGTGSQQITLNGSIAGVINSLSVENTSGSPVQLLGSLASLTTNSLNITAGVMNDGAKILKVTGNVTINATHTGNGYIELAGSTSQTITSNGSGQFENLVLNNTSGTTGDATVALDGNIKINNAMRLVTDRVFNIATSGITLQQNSTLTTSGNGFSVTKFIRTSGNQSDAGISRFAFNNATPLLFPIGTSGLYTPVTATFSGISTSDNQGYIQVSVNNATLSTLSATGVANSALLYNWRVRRSGFISTPMVAYTFNSSVTGIWPTGVVGTPNNFVGGRIVIPNRIAETTTVTSDGLVSIASHSIPSDAAYTAAQTGRFNGSVRLLYNRTGGNQDYNINANGAWSLTTHTGASAGTITPGPNDIIVMRNRATNNQRYHWNQNYTVAGVIFDWDGVDINTLPRIYIGSNSGTPTNVNAYFGFVRGAGYVQVNVTPTFVQTITGDFGEYNDNSNSLFLYEQRTSPGTVNLPALPNEFPNLRIQGNDLNDETYVINLPNSDFTINKNLTIRKGIVVNVNSGSGGNMNVLGNFELGESPDPSRTSILRLPNSGTNRTITVEGNLVIGEGSNTKFEITSGGSSSTLHTLNIKGNITKGNNSTFNMCNTAAAMLKLSGSTSATYSSVGNNMSIYRLEIDKGTSQSSTFTFNSPFTICSPSNITTKPITFTNGLLILSSSGISINLSSGGGTVSLPSTSGLEVTNNSSVSMSSTTGLLLDGLLRIGNNGTANFNDGTNYTYIEYSASNNARIEVLGNASLNVGGQIRRNTSSNAGTLQYVQTGGNVTIAGIGANTTNGKFELDNAGSSISMTGGNLYIQRGGGTTFGDLYLNPGTSNITGGNIIFSPLTAIGSQSYRIISSPALNNLSLLNAGTSSATGTLFVYPLTINNQLTISEGSTLNTNGFDVASNGNVSIAGAFIPNTATVSFTGSTLQNLAISQPTSFYNFVLNKSNTLSFSGVNSTINGTLSILNGTLNDGGISILVNGNVINQSVHTGTGKIIFGGSAPNAVSGNGSSHFQNIEIKNSNSVNFNNDFSINGLVQFTQGSIYIGANALTLGELSSVTGTSSAKFFRTNGVMSDLGVIKNFGANSFDYTFHVGVFGKYTPARFNALSNTVSGSIRVTPVNSVHPLATDPANKQLNYYWEVENSGLGGLFVNHTYTYDPSDVNGDLNGYKFGRNIFGDWAPYYGGFESSVAGINTVLGVFTLNGVDFVFGEYSAGESSELQQVLTYYSRNATQGGAWTDINTWSTDQILKHDGAVVASGLAPYGQPVVIKSGHLVTSSGNFMSSYSTSIAGTLSIGTTFGHNLGIIAGEGILKIQANPSLLYVLPAGEYASFTSSITGGTMEFSSDLTGNIPAINPPSFPNFNNVIFSGNGVKKISSTTPNVVVTGNLSILGGTLENTADNNIILYKNWINTVGQAGFNRGFTYGSYVEFAGSNQSVLGQNIFGGVNVSGGGTKYFSDNTTINGLLQLNSGIVDMGNKILSIETSQGSVSGGSSSSYIDGFLQKRYITGSNQSHTFEVGDAGYSPLVINYPSVTQQGNVLVKAVQGTHPNIATSCINGAKGVNRHWIITTPGPLVLPTNYSVAATFLNPSDLVGSPNTSSLIPSLYTGSVWSLPGIGTRTSTSTQATTVQTYGGLALAEANSSVEVTITGTVMPVCAGTVMNFTANGINGGTAPGYNWVRISSGNTFTGQSLNQTYSVSTLLGGDIIRAIYSSSSTVCTFGNPATSNAITVSYSPTYQWTGISNSQWSDNLNWCGNILPGISSDITVNSGTPFSPVISTSVMVNSLAIGSGATFTLTAAGALTLTGNLTNNGTFAQAGSSTLNMIGTTAQQIGGTTNTSFENLLLRNTSGVSLTSNQSVRGTLTLGNSTTLNSNGNLILKSDATQTGRLAQVPASSSVIGAITVERYIPAKITNRFLSSPVQNATFDHWRNFGINTTTGRGILLTGHTGGDAGSPAPTVMLYNETLAGIQNIGYVRITNTANTITSGLGYRVLVRGDRTINLTAPGGYTANPTTIAVTGTPVIGNVQLPITYTSTSSATADGWNLVGNPYPSQIDWNLVIAQGGLTKVENAIYVQDPGSNTTALGCFFSYVNGVAAGCTFSGMTNPSIIASSQGFIIKATATGANISLTESMKTGSSHTGRFREQSIPNLLYIILKNNTYEDNTAIRIAEGATSNFDAGYDARKLMSAGLNIYSIAPDGTDLSINTVDALQEDVRIPIGVTSINKGVQKMQFNNLSTFDNFRSLILTDKWLNTSQKITNNMEYTFEITSAAGSYMNRFYIHATIDYGYIKVNIYPQDLAQAQWTLDGKTWHSSNTGIIKMPVNNYSLQFSIIDGYDTPADISLILTKDSIHTHNIIYSPKMAPNQVIQVGNVTTLEHTNGVSKIYPVPLHAGQNLTLELYEKGLEILKIEIINSEGKVIYNTKPFTVNAIYKKEFGYSMFAPGFYTINISTKSGNISHKIIVE
ncbi:MAG: T9SS type A sorting domain-containing protein [Cytophagales bacterium]|nr:T9SS type A sorting domain-containing protein [Cytophagales bacterium]